MKNKKIINEISRIMEIMKVSLINEGPVGPRPKFSFDFSKTHKLFDDASIKKFNLDIDNALPTVTTKKKLTTAGELENILDNFSDTKWDDMKPAERKFLLDLNNKMADADPNFLKNVTDDFFTRIYKDVKDPLSKAELLTVLKAGFNSKHQIKIEELLSVKSASYNEETKNPITKWFNKITGSNKNTSQDAGIFAGVMSSLLKNRLIQGGIAISILCKYTKAGASVCQFAGDKLDEMAQKLNFTDGQQLFLSILKEDPLPTSDVDSLCESFGRDKNTIQKDVDLFYDMGDWRDVTLTELSSIITNLGQKYDGFGLIIFNKLFELKDPQGKNIYQWLISEDISDQEISSTVKKYVPIGFSIFREMSETQPEMSEIELLISKYLNLTNTGATGVESIFIKIDKDSWTPIGKNVDITTNHTTDGKQIILSVDTQIEIQQKAKELLGTYLSQVEDSNPIPTSVEAAKSLVINQPGQEKSWLNKLDWESVDKVLTPQLDKYFKDTLGKLSWDWYHAINKQQIESKIGLSNLLLENKKKILTEDEKKPKNTGGGGSTTKTKFPGPGTVQEFQDWLDTHYPTWLNGGKLDKGTGYGNYGGNTQKAFGIYSTEYQKSLTSGGNVNPPAEVDKEKQIFDKFNDSIWFFSTTNNERMNIEYRPEMAKTIKYLRGKNYIEECSYLGAILALYGRNISKYKTDIDTQNKIDTQLPSLQKYLQTIFEGIQLKRPNGLSQILEQVSDFVVVNVINGIPKKQTEDDNYKDMSNVTIKSIIGGGTELRKGDKSGTVASIKNNLGYKKDNTIYFTEDFNTFLINYKGRNKLDNSNGNISNDLICSIEQYQQLCSTYSAKKTTAPTEQKQLPIEVKYLNDYATAVGTGTPSEGPCKSLFDYYAKQAKDWDLGNKAGSPNAEITDELLKNVKTAVKRCKIGLKKNFYPSDRKYITDKNNPFYIVDFYKEGQKTATTPKPTTPTVPTNNTPNPVDN
jgi:hypothetical protein